MSRLLASALAIGPMSGAESDIVGWPTLRVMEQLGSPEFMRVVDTNQDGKEELLVINRRQSRLDWYRWRPDGVQPAGQSDEINHLPLSPEFQHQEVVLDQIPHDAVVMPDQSIWLLTGPQLKLEHWRCRDDRWQRIASRDLLPASLDRRQPLRYRPASQQILVPCQQGIMVVDLTGDARPQWLRPSYQQRLKNWDLVDLDQDGRQDLLLQQRRGHSAPVWARQDTSGMLRPPRDLSQDPIGNYVLARGPQPWVVAIDPEQQHLVRSYGLAKAEPSLLGRSDPLALPEGAA